MYKWLCEAASEIILHPFRFTACVAIKDSSLSKPKDHITHNAAQMKLGPSDLHVL